MASAPPPVSKPPKAPATRKAPPPAPSRTPATTVPAKTFSIKPWTGAGEGEKIIGYGPSGMGKTTLFSMMPNPVFVGLDDGGRKIRNPKTGKAIEKVDGIVTFQDLRDALHDTALWKSYETVVIDTATKLEELTEAHVLATLKTDKGQTASTLEHYGYGKGYKHMLDHLRFILTDLDALVRDGKNIGLICQSSDKTVSNPESLDYVQAGPKLHHNNQHSSRLEICEWADHVLRIGYLDNRVVKSDAERRAKVASDDVTRAVFAQDGRWFFAKSRTLTDAVVSFATVDDDSIWQLLFGESNEANSPK